MKKLQIFCIAVLIFGIALFFLTPYLLPDTSPIFVWCIGLAAAMIVLGLGYFLNSLIELSKINDFNHSNSYLQTNDMKWVKEKAGYLVCKVMSILLCINLLILSKITIEPLILLLSTALVIIQYVLNFALLIYYANHREK